MNQGKIDGFEVTHASPYTNNGPFMMARGYKFVDQDLGGRVRVATLNEQFELGYPGNDSLVRLLEVKAKGWEHH